MAAANGLYLYEFLYRGRPSGSKEAPAYHVILAQDNTDAFGNKSTALSGALTPDQAKERGFDLPDIVSDINASLTASVETLTADKAALAEEVETLKAQLAEGEKTAA